MNDVKNLITNIIAIVVGVFTAVQTALNNVPDNAKWYVWVGAIAVTVIAYFTGKGSDGKKIKK